MSAAALLRAARLSTRPASRATPRYVSLRSMASSSGSAGTPSGQDAQTASVEGTSSEPSVKQANPFATVNAGEAAPAPVGTATPAFHQQNPFASALASREEIPDYFTSRALDMPPTAGAEGYPLPEIKKPFGMISSVTNTNIVKCTIHVRATPNNIMVSLMDAKGGLYKDSWFSGGRCGFKGVKRSDYEAGYQTASRAFRRLREVVLEPADQKRMPVEIELVFKGFGKGRDAFLQALQLSEGDAVRPLIIRVTDKTPIKIGGTRPKKKRWL